MRTVSMLEFRQSAEKVIQELRRGVRKVLTYRGEPVARLEPIDDQEFDEDDPFYALDQLADDKGQSLTNSQIDKIVYGE